MSLVSTFIRLILQFRSQRHDEEELRVSTILLDLNIIAFLKVLFLKVFSKFYFSKVPDFL